MPEFSYSDLLPTGTDSTEYRLLTTDGVSVQQALGRDFLQIEPEVLTQLTAAAMHDIAHLLRPAHLASSARSSTIRGEPNDRFVALDLLKNANIAAGGVLPMCQDTGTAIVFGKKGQRVLMDGDEEEALSWGVHRTYTEANLRYSQMAPLSMYEEVNTGNNLPVQFDIRAAPASTTSSCLSPRAAARRTRASCSRRPGRSWRRTVAKFLEEKMKTLGTSACPPYHLAIVIGGTSAELTLKTVKLASARWLDTLPTGGSAGHAFRDMEMEQQVLERGATSASARSSAESISATTCG